MLCMLQCVMKPATSMYVESEGAAIEGVKTMLREAGLHEPTQKAAAPPRSS